MEPSPEKYRRLTKNNSEVGSYTSLWLGSDHVMIVRSSGYHEEYVRLHLGEIRAVFLTVTERRRWWGLFWGIVAGGGVLPFLVSSGGGYPQQCGENQKLWGIAYQCVIRAVQTCTAWRV